MCTLVWCPPRPGALDLLGLESQAVISHLTLVLGTALKPSLQPEPNNLEMGTQQTL